MTAAAHRPTAGAAVRWGLNAAPCPLLLHAPVHPAPVEEWVETITRNWTDDGGRAVRVAAPAPDDQSLPTRKTLLTSTLDAAVTKAASGEQHMLVADLTGVLAGADVNAPDSPLTRLVDALRGCVAASTAPGGPALVVVVTSLRDVPRDIGTFQTVMTTGKPPGAILHWRPGGTERLRPLPDEAPYGAVHRFDTEGWVRLPLA